MQSFAGLHIQGKRLAIFIDEPSTVADVIFEVIEGALTDKDTEIEHLNLLALPADEDLPARMIAVEAELNRQGRLQIESK